MDSFTIAVLVGDGVILITFLLLVLMDKKAPPATDSGKPAGKRSA
jgi:hypothetical protein